MPKIVIDNLTDALISEQIAAHRAAGTTVSRITIGGGLFLDQPLTRAIWRMRYITLAGKPNNLTFGAWSPAQRGNNVQAARARRDEALAKLAKNIDPAVERNETAKVVKATNRIDAINNKRLARGKSALHSFQHIAEQFLVECAGRHAAEYVTAREQLAAKWVYPLIGETNIAQVTPLQALAVTTALQATGKFTTLGKARRFITDVYNFSNRKQMQLGLPKEARLCPVVPDETLYDAQPTTVNRLAVIDGQDFASAAQRAEQTERVRKLVVDLGQCPEHLDDNPSKGLLLMLLTAQRTSNVAEARKADFDLEASRWVIPAEAMKGRVLAKRRGLIKDQVVMLSTQAVALVRAQFAAYPDSEWVFPGKPKGHMGKGGIVLTGKPMNEKAMNKRLHHLGYKGEQTGHGLRALKRNAGESLAGINPLVLEASLAHKAAVKHIEDGGMGPAYKRNVGGIDEAFHLREEQTWADWLDGLAAPQKPALTLVATSAPADQLQAA